jgi:hypothetical protein
MSALATVWVAGAAAVIARLECFFLPRMAQLRSRVASARGAFRRRFSLGMAL